jgi:solute:Na+ symporter, SSS family
MFPHLSVFDAAIAGGFFLLTLVIGSLFASRQQRIEDYFLAAKVAPWWLVLMSIVTTETSVLTVVSLPGTSFDPRGGNFAWLQLALGYMCGRIVVSLILLPAYLHKTAISVYEFLKDRCNLTTQRCASSLFVVTRSTADGLRLYLAGLVISSITGCSTQLAILLTCLGTLIYTVTGGMKAVLWTDVLQFGMKLLGGLLLVIFVVARLPGGVDELIEIGNAHHKFQIFNWSLDPAEPLTFWSGLIGGFFLTMGSHGTDQLIAQRCMSARSLRHAQFAMALSGIVIFLLFCLFLTVGVGLYALKVKGILQIDPGTPNDQAVPIAIRDVLPRGFAGLLLAALIASSMSTLSASINSLAAVSVSDFHWRQTPVRTESQRLGSAKLATVFWAVVQFAIASLAATSQQKQSLIGTVLTVSGLYAGLVLGLFGVAWSSSNVSSTATLLGVVSGLVVAAFLGGATFFGKAMLGWPWYTGVVAATVLVTSLAANSKFGPDGQASSSS